MNTMKTEYKIALGLSILMSVGSLLIIVKNLQGGFIAPAIAWGVIAWCYYKKNHQAVKYSLLVFGSIYAIGSAILMWGILNFSTTEFDIKNFVVLAAAVVISPAVISFQYFANEMQRREHEQDFATQQQRTRVSAYVFVACVLGLMLNAIPDNISGSTTSIARVGTSGDTKVETRFIKGKVRTKSDDICDRFEDVKYISTAYFIDKSKNQIIKKLEFVGKNGTTIADIIVLDNCTIIDNKNWKCGGETHYLRGNQKYYNSEIEKVINGKYDFTLSTYEAPNEECTEVRVQVN
jgi:hypothetical protein